MGGVAITGMVIVRRDRGGAPGAIRPELEYSPPPLCPPFVTSGPQDPYGFITARIGQSPEF